MTIRGLWGTKQRANECSNTRKEEKLQQKLIIEKTQIKDGDQVETELNGFIGYRLRRYWMK